MSFDTGTSRAPFRKKWILGFTAQFGKQIRREIFRQGKIWNTQEYFVYFACFKAQHWRKTSAEALGRNCAVMPYYDIPIQPAESCPADTA